MTNALVLSIALRLAPVVRRTRYLRVLPLRRRARRASWQYVRALRVSHDLMRSVLP